MKETDASHYETLKAEMTKKRENAVHAKMSTWKNACCY